MKCVKTPNGAIVRVADEQAVKMVDNKNFFYCSKEEWKATKRKGADGRWV